MVGLYPYHNQMDEKFAHREIFNNLHLHSFMNVKLFILFRPMLKSIQSLEELIDYLDFNILTVDMMYQNMQKLVLQIPYYLVAWPRFIGKSPSLV